MKVTVSVPGKTFLLGEYHVLKTGKAIGIATHPKFELLVESSENTELIGIDLMSPAGRLYTKFKNEFSLLKIEFIDPYSGKGGAGASTAQFALLYAFLKRLELSRLGQGRLTATQIKECLAQYEDVAWDGQGVKPSGADLLVQVSGMCVVVDKTNDVMMTSSMEWPFEDLEVLIVHTGNKVATHEHLMSLSEVNVSELEAPYLKSVDGFLNRDSHNWLMGVSEYGKALKKAGYVCESTSQLLQELSAHSEILASKGNGALGADTLSLYFRPEKRLAVEQICHEMNLPVVGSSQRLSTGIGFGIEDQEVWKRELDV